jgi:hypothetical protein
MVEEKENHLSGNRTVGSPKGTPMEESHSLRTNEMIVIDVQRLSSNTFLSTPFLI